MQEVLARTVDPNLPLQEQEYYELRLDDLGFPFRPQFIYSLGIVPRHRFIIRGAHAAWSEIGWDIMWGAMTMMSALRLRKRRSGTRSEEPPLWTNGSFIPI